MTGRELINALLEGDEHELFDLDDDVFLEDPCSGWHHKILTVLSTRQQSRPTARPATTIVLSSTDQV